MTDDRDDVRLVHAVIDVLGLDLRGLSVLTEAATGPFSVTAAIAMTAGADRVVAVTRNSAYGTAVEAEQETRRVARACQAGRPLEIVSTLNAQIVREIDLITNLGFVRPLDAQTISWMKSTAVIALMCENWEFRPGDVDMVACEKQEVIVLATNEHSPQLPVFSHCGTLALHMLAEAGFAPQGLRVAVLGCDPFTPVIVDALRSSGADVRTDEALTPDSALGAISGAQLILVAVYASDIPVLGNQGVLTAVQVALAAPGTTVLQYAGAIDADDLLRNGINVWPIPTVGPHRMSRTLAHLGVRPVAELHAAGLRVGEIGARARLSGLAPAAAIAEACRRSDLVQALILS